MRASYATTLIAKLLTATTFHSWTALVSLHPKFAPRALFEFSSFCIINERTVFWVHSDIISILLARHILMEFASTLQAILVMTFFAGIFRDGGIELKQGVAVGSGAP
jgi:hypothetical protein